MQNKQLIWILWPSFIVAGAALAVFFTVFDPQDLQLLRRAARVEPHGDLLGGVLSVLDSCSRLQRAHLLLPAHQRRDQSRPL